MQDSIPKSTTQDGDQVDPKVIEYLNGLVNFHVVEGDISEDERTDLGDLWLGFIEGDLEKMRQVMVNLGSHPDRAYDLLTCFIADFGRVSNDWGSTFQNSQTSGALELNLMYGVQGQWSRYSMREFGTKRYAFILSSHADTPVRLYCWEKDDAGRSALDASSGYRQNLDQVFLSLRQQCLVKFQDLIKRKQEGFYSPYCDYSPEGWQVQKQRRDQHRRFLTAQAQRRDKLANEPAYLKRLRAIGRRFGIGE